MTSLLVGSLTGLAEAGLPQRTESAYGATEANVGAARASVAAAAGSQITLHGAAYDFTFDHPDFESELIADDRGIVKEILGDDLKPVYAYDPPDHSPTTTGRANFDQWYRPVGGVNVVVPVAITLDKLDTEPPLYQYTNDSFFPLDGKGWKDESDGHNFAFTYELHSTFTYNPGQVLEFRADDDLWVFIEGHRVVDLGGIHGVEPASVDLDGVASSFALVAGQRYPLDIFFAERHTASSSFAIKTSLQLRSASPPIGRAPSAREWGAGGNCACRRGRSAHGYHAEPVDSATGTFFETVDDLTIPGRGSGLTMSHSYSSVFASDDGPLGFGWSFPYSMHLRFDGTDVVVVQENGSETTFLDAGSGSYAPAAPRFIATLSKASGLYTFLRDATQTFVFNASGQLLSENDRNGYSTTLQYSGGHLDSVTDPTNRKLKLTWTGSHITDVADESTPPRHVSFKYLDGQGNLNQVIDAFGGVTNYGYDTAHQLKTILDSIQSTSANPSPVKNSYDTTGRVHFQDDELGRRTTFDYASIDANTTQSTITRPKSSDPNGNVTVETYTFGLRTDVVEGAGTPEATTTHYDYDPVTLGIASVSIDAPNDANHYPTTTTYLENGQPETVIDAVGRQTSYRYNEFNQPLTVTTPNPATTGPATVTTSYTYDGKGNLTSESRPLHKNGTVQDQTIVYHRDDLNHPDDVTSTTDAAAKIWQYTYWPQGYLRKSVTPLQHVTKHFYDATGRRTSTVTPRGNEAGADPNAFTTTYGYDALDRLILTSVANGDTPVVSQSEYDANGNLHFAIDGNGNKTINEYDLADELTKVDRPGTIADLVNDYWPDGNLHHRYDGASNPTTYDYDALGRVKIVTDALSRKTTYKYAGNDAVKTKKDSDNAVTTSNYNDAGELTGIDYSSAATHDVSFGYGPTGLRTSMTETGTSTWTYDSLGRLKSSTNGAGATVGYGYDLRDDAKKIKYPGGQTVKRTLDDDRRLASVKDWLHPPIIFSYTPDAMLETVTYPNGVVSTYGYDNADQLNAVTHKRGTSVLASFVYTHDGAGQLRSDVHAGVPGANETYKYTELEQLKKVNGVAYKYDAADNLTRHPSGQTQTYDAANQLCWTSPSPSANSCASSPAGATTFSYDVRGNRRTTTPPSGPASTFGYDQANRLTTYASGPASATYIYNGDGLRMAKTVSEFAHAFTWNAAEGLPLLLRDNATSIVYGPDGLAIEQITGSAATYLHHDQLQSVRLETDAAGNPTATATYDAYGRRSATTGAPTSLLGYNGQYLDTETGFVYLRARYYDPATGQFLSRDPLISLTTSAYGYVDGNPLNSTDPAGLRLCLHNPLPIGPRDRCESFWKTNPATHGPLIAVEAVVCVAACAEAAAAIASTLPAGAVVALYGGAMACYTSPVCVKALEYLASPSAASQLVGLSNNGNRKKSRSCPSPSAPSKATNPHLVPEGERNTYPYRNDSGVNAGDPTTYDPG